MSKDKTKVSKTLSYILRHKPEKFGIKLDKHGWANISDILIKLDVDLDTIKDVVSSCDKQRFQLSDDISKIRASQGHTIKVDVQLKKCTPPIKLYHGTKSQFIDDIMKDGLKPMRRQHVHLSKDLETAEKVSSRRKGDSIILEISARQMMLDGLDIYISQNGVYLTEYVPSVYLTEYVPSDNIRKLL